MDFGLYGVLELTPTSCNTYQKVLFIYPLSNHLPAKQGHLIVAYNNRSNKTQFE
jgi:hypothetical protein